MRISEKTKKTIIRMIALGIASIMFIGIFIFALLELLL